jgi:predicted DNA-binding transcriptional regulator YafY
MYKRSRVIEERLQRIIGMLRSGRYSARSLADSLGVSTPTVFRCVAALKERGYPILARRDRVCWWYELDDSDGTIGHPCGRAVRESETCPTA